MHEQMSVQQRIELLKKDATLRKWVINFSIVKTHRQVGAIVFNWFVILATAITCHYYWSLWSYSLAVIIISCRQHALLVMMHEAAHFRISKKPWLNDFLGNAFAAYPTLASTEWYRKHHTAHHKNTNTDQDPDWARKIHLADWQFPQSHLRLFKMMIHQLIVGGRDWLKLMAKITGFDKKKIAYLIVVPLALTATGLGPALALYWCLPLLTLFPLIQRVRSISEHFGLRYDHELNGTRDTLANPIERFLFLPHHVGFHLVHHLFPSVPHYNLSGLHKVLMSYATYRELAHSNDSIFLSEKSVLRDLTSPKNKSATSSANQPAA